MPAAVASQWRDRRRRVFQSVFQDDVSLPAPLSTSPSRHTDTRQPFGDPAASVLHPEPSLQAGPAQPLSPSRAAPADDQAAYDCAWHTVTAHIALPASAAADVSFGNRAAQSHPSSRSQDIDSDFLDALALLVNASTLLPRATHTGDIVAWHIRRVRAHFTQHVIPLLAGCVDDEAEDWADEDGPGNGPWRSARGGSYYEKHMAIVVGSIRTLEAALRLYFYGLNQLLLGFSRLSEGSLEAAHEAELLSARFRRDIQALVTNSASEGLMKSVKCVLARLARTILGMPSRDEPVTGGRRVPRPASPGDDDLRVTAARERLLELVRQLHNVGLAGERFQVLFAEVMDAMMSAFITGAYAGIWSASDARSLSAGMGTASRTTLLSTALASPCIASLDDWVENHFARLSCEVLACISADPRAPLPVSLADLKTYQALALGRLAALRIEELFDIVLTWPDSRSALDDLRATITTAARRKQLTDSFSRALQTRLLHPGCSTLEILQTYISIIRTLHALDHSKVLLSHVESSLQLYLCQREDAVRVVVAGLLASPEEVRAARKLKGGRSGRKEKAAARRDSSPEAEETPGQKSTAATLKTGHVPKPTKLVELAVMLSDPSQTRRAAPDLLDVDLDWDDMNWVPDPVDAGANYKRPKSEDVIGTLISALGSEDVFIKEFSAVLAGLLLGEPARFDQELRVLELLKRRFGEAALQNCDVMIKDVQDSRKVDAAIRKARRGAGSTRQAPATPPDAKAAATATAAVVPEVPQGEREEAEEDMEYRARILSRLFWPDLDREHFLLPQPIVEQQRRYEKGYESLKSRRKLTWLNQLGQARVELELQDRAVAVDCSPVEATVIYAFQQEAADSEGQEEEEEEDNSNPPPPPAQKSIEELYAQLQMDEDLITSALQFWVAKGVLRRVNNESYVVVETLNAAAAAAAPTTTADAAIDDAEKNNDKNTMMDEGATTKAGSSSSLPAKERERREMYWRYIQGMLTNASATMPLGQMAMMMKMLIADGFPWSNEELQEFLAEKVAAGELEVVGGKYRLVKK